MVLPGLWAGILFAVALIAAPSAFATLSSADAGRLVGRLLSIEARASLLFAISFVLLERWATGASLFDANLLLALGALFCTVAGHFAVLPLMADARADRGALSFGQLHAASLVAYAVKSGLVALLAWRVTASSRPSSSDSPDASSHA